MRFEDLFLGFLLILVFAALFAAKQAIREKNVWKRRFFELQKAAIRQAQEADRAVLALEQENDELRVQIRRHQIIAKSAFDSAKRFHRERCDREAIL